MTDENRALTTTKKDLATRDTLAGMGKAADAAASLHLFADYRKHYQAARRGPCPVC
jgi:hypothetical protein